MEPYSGTEEIRNSYVKGPFEESWIVLDILTKANYLGISIDYSKTSKYWSFLSFVEI